MQDLNRLISDAENFLNSNSSNRKQVMEYEDARRLVYEIGKMMLNKKGREWVTTKQSASVIVELTKYFINDPTCIYDLDKGIHLIGDIGVGKTFLMDVMNMLCKVAKIKDRQFEMVSTTDIVESMRFFEKFGDRDSELPLAKFSMGKVYCFDDLGLEQVSIKVFGNNVVVMENILTKRYRHYTTTGKITHITGNDTPKELLGKYGSRVMDRVREMCNAVYIGGKSLR